MPLINWNDRMSVNIAEIDMQHQKLVKLLNDLYDDMKKGQGIDVISKTVKELVNYAKIHFKTEEDYFDQYEYPEADNHRRTHSVFTDKIFQFKNNLKQKDAGLPFDVIQFMSLWLKDHILETDKKYSNFLNEKGLK